jgi:hypothetical protein
MRKKPTPSKKHRKPPDWDRLEIEDFIHDEKERARKLKGPSEEAKKLLNKSTR